MTTRTPALTKARAQAAVEPRDEGLGNLRDSLEGYTQDYHEGYYYVAFDAEGLEDGCPWFGHSLYPLGIFAHYARKHQVESRKDYGGKHKMPPRSINLPIRAHSYQTDLGSNGHPQDAIYQNQMPCRNSQHNRKDKKSAIVMCPQLYYLCRYGSID